MRESASRNLGPTREKKDAHFREKLTRARADVRIARVGASFTVDVNTDESERVRILRGEIRALFSEGTSIGYWQGIAQFAIGPKRIRNA